MIYYDRSGMLANHLKEPGIALTVIGAAASAALVIWGIVDSYYSAEKYNTEHLGKSISVSPLIMPSSSPNGENGMAYGLAVAGRF